MTDLGRYSTLWRGMALSALALVGALAMVGATRLPAASLDGTPVGSSSPLGALEQRLAAMDGALARKDLSRAVHEWRDAYGIALRTRRWDAMAAVGDAALRVDALAGRDPGGSTAFRAEARQAYLRTLFLARGTGSVGGVHRAADAFAALGDREMAVRARAVLDAHR
jgi:hypothetical protein